MIAEAREKAEHGPNYNVEQKLQSYLRDKFSTDSIEHAAVIPLLITVAKDYDMKDGVRRSQQEYARLAEDAITNYQNNWHDKEQGEDDRGHRFAKSSYF